MARRNLRKIGLSKPRIALSLIQQSLSHFSGRNISKINGYVSKKVKRRRTHYNIGKDTIFPNGIKAEILKRFINQVLVIKRDSKKSAALRKRLTNNLALNQLVDSPRTIIISVLKEVFNNLPKVGLISPLIDTGAASVEMIYFVLRGKMTKRDALKHVIKETRGTLNSSAGLLGTLLILRALSYIPTPGRIAVLMVGNIAVKKLQNKHATK